MDELKILALETRNHLCAIFKDREVWQEALRSLWHTTVDSVGSSANLSGWKETGLVKQPGKLKGQGDSNQHGKHTYAIFRRLTLTVKGSRNLYRGKKFAACNFRPQ